MGMLPRSGGAGGGSGNGCCQGDVNVGIVIGADGKPSTLLFPDFEAVKEALEKKADLVGGKVPLAQLPPIGDSLDRGAFVDEAALKAAHPTDVAGAYATVASTETMWLWNVAEATWKDSGQAPVGAKGPEGDKGPRGDAGPAGSRGGREQSSGYISGSNGGAA